MCSDQPPKIHSGVKAEWCRYPLSRSAKQTPGLHAFNKDLDILFFLVANILGTAAQCFSLQTNWLVCLSTHRSNITLFFFQLGGWSRRTARLSVFLVNSKPRFQIDPMTKCSLSNALCHFCGGLQGHQTSGNTLLWRTAAHYELHHGPGFYFC